MEEKINSVKAEIVCDYINQIETAIDVYNPVFENSEEIIEVLIEVVNVFAEDIPQIKDSILLRSGTQIRDANTAIALLKMYLANNGIKYEGKEKEENANIKRFWASFILWFENELVDLGLLQEKYLRWDNWDGGMWILDLNYDL